MPFYRVDLGDGKTAVVHMRLSRRNEPKQCRVRDGEFPSKVGGQPDICGRIAVALCDHEAKPDHLFAELPERFNEDVLISPTCSMPICEKHRHHVDPDRDYCPRHKEPHARE